jgi:hypothetical protein
MVLGGCATAPSSSRADVVRVAKDEVIRHGESIPNNWFVVVVPSNTNFEFRSAYPVYIVRFQRDRSERSTVFQVVVNPKSLMAEEFSDMRTIIPED